MYGKAVAANNAGMYILMVVTPTRVILGDTFPIWGTCMGFQTLAIMSSHNDQILTRFDGVVNVVLPLDFNTTVLAKSNMFGNAPEDIIKACVYYHDYT